MNKQIEQLQEAFAAHGYVVLAEPVSGYEVEFLNSLRGGFAKVERVLQFNAKHYGYRGRSKAALVALHQNIPVPCFGVVVR